jgi:hypothetical protein
MGGGERQNQLTCAAKGEAQPPPAEVWRVSNQHRNQRDQEHEDRRFEIPVKNLSVHDEGYDPCGEACQKNNGSLIVSLN